MVNAALNVTEMGNLLEVGGCSCSQRFLLHLFSQRLSAQRIPVSVSGHKALPQHHLEESETESCCAVLTVFIVCPVCLMTASR